jgi:hypothetical protein
MIYRFRRSDVHQEEDVLPWRKLLLVFLGLFAIAGVLTAWAGSYLDACEARLRPSGFFPEKTIGTRREVTGVEQDLFGEMGSGQLLNRRQSERLRKFEWVDRDRRIITVPIDQAMDLVIEESHR